jgi:hypothetical protein
MTTTPPPDWEELFREWQRRQGRDDDPQPWNAADHQRWTDAWDGNDEGEESFYLADIVPEEGPGVMFGRFGDGKSIIAKALGYTMCTGLAMIPGIPPPARPGPLLWVDAEDSPRRTRRRLRALSPERVPIHYVRLLGPLTSEREQLRLSRLAEHYGGSAGERGMSPSGNQQ